MVSRNEESLSPPQPKSHPKPARSIWDRLGFAWRKNPSRQSISGDTTPPLPKIEPTVTHTTPAKAVTPENPTTSSGQPSPEKQALPSRQTGIGEVLIGNLKKLGITIETEGFETIGVAARGATNEQGNPALFEKVRNQAQAPNGYLIGIGAANVFSMLEAFPQGITPKAILLFDIDPQVVAAGQQIIENLKGQPATDAVVKTGKQVIRQGGNCDYKAALEKYHPLLRQLAKEGNLIIARVDFTDPRLVNELKKLPDIDKLNNVIYLSNIVDHLSHRASRADVDFVPDFTFLNSLQPQPPHRNYYIDTLQTSLDYQLRIGLHPPVFSKFDFLSTPLKIQTRPVDEIDPSTENPVWEDIGQWDFNRLISTYRELSNSPTQKQRKTYIEQRIRDERSEIALSYDEYKEKAQQPPKEVIPSLHERYVVPNNPAEERALLAELAQPYDYDRDFIPFIAHSLWANADFPWLIDPYKLPKRDNFAIDSQTGVRMLTFDTRNAAKGKIEVGWIETSLPFEEVALAKLYWETAKRILQTENPALTPNRSFDELITEIKP